MTRSKKDKIQAAETRDFSFWVREHGIKVEKSNNAYLVMTKGGVRGKFKNTPLAQKYIRRMFKLDALCDNCHADLTDTGIIERIEGGWRTNSVKKVKIGKKWIINTEPLDEDEAEACYACAECGGTIYLDEQQILAIL